ncbi:MAG: FAD-binding oxidoreductase [Planctomycetaceae bacterium]|nr:FAD-binding oxidoreductase [Planctomycetaceae bacterium]
MPAAAPSKPLSLETHSPGTPAELAETVRAAYDSSIAIYPLGGRTALHCGTKPKAGGWSVATEKLSSVVDYPARDLTITVEAGITVEALQATLAGEHQFLPVDIAQPARATLGGALAVNFSGPGRYGHGTLRDYVIGISAVDGTGTAFSAGGRVVKNVAGYDFCKLLVGSLGTLGVITQVTLKVKPQPTARAYVVHPISSPTYAESLATAIIQSQTTPTAVQVVGGPACRDLIAKCGGDEMNGLALLVGLEGTGVEVEWMIARLRAEWRSLGFEQPLIVDDAAASATIRRQLTEFGCGDDSKQPIVLRLTCRPSATTQLCELVRSQFAATSLIADPVCGVVLAQLPELAMHELAGPVIGTLQPAATAVGGQCVVWNSPTPEELTRQLCWGSARDSDAVLRRVKSIFDPKGILNPGRFVFS